MRFTALAGEPLCKHCRCCQTRACETHTELLELCRRVSFSDFLALTFQSKMTYGYRKKKNLRKKKKILLQIITV